MTKQANLEATCGLRIGATMLFHTHSGENDFGADVDIYNKVYGIGFRSVQIQPSVQKDNWLLGLKQWAEEQKEKTHVHTIDFFVNTGETPACPVSEYADRRKRAQDAFTEQLRQAELCGSRSHFGPFSSGLLAGHYIWTSEHDDRAIEFFSWARGPAKSFSKPIEVEPLNRFEAGVSTLAHMQRLITKAQASEFLRLGPDTFHQHVSEEHTVNAWKAHDANFGLTGHLSDDGRSVLGREQALTRSGVLPYLASGRSSIQTWNIEAFGGDVHPGIAAALCLRNLPAETGLEVMRLSFQRMVDAFARF